MTSPLDALDMSLADIIKTNKTTKRTRNTNNKAASKGSGSTRTSGGPIRNARGSRDRKKKPFKSGVEQYKGKVKAAPAAPLHTSVIRQSVPDGSKIQISNLDNRVTAEDLKVVFTSRVGPLKKCTLVYDQHGKSTGTASVHFTRVGDAAIAMQKFNGVPLDGRPMKIELIVAPGAAQAVLGSGKPPKAATSNQGQQKRGGGAANRGRLLKSHY
ncbi:hypothetical protein BCR41DRAFT_233772 [Lobosporangium transversale]|uniref:RRM domain-containing protein n=1 Tax=Lobosporangium transversale TaxID=64571 RepID=A0A1Y2GX36_9FUNG|nr:hypothetical protein BCR41DRAFT_233772 [Lobosporangium transversale]ORZ24797.1 hypothetical protein BCR41DRAFT_233772 [Lobosporangium transversale]|eukprot:XP_021883778.1 hypothetical protein BCR41DRAFT_233772 [Lobosporangium transversale]